MTTEFKMPKTLGACADRVYLLRKKRLDLEKTVEALKAEESAVREHVIQNLPKSDASGVAGRLARVTVKTKDVPQVKDWAKFHKYLKKTGNFELMQRRLSDQAVLERLEDGEKVPGVEIFVAVTLSVNKV